MAEVHAGNSGQLGAAMPGWREVQRQTPQLFGKGPPRRGGQLIPLADAGEQQPVTLADIHVQHGGQQLPALILGEGIHIFDEYGASTLGEGGVVVV